MLQNLLGMEIPKPEFSENFWNSWKVGSRNGSKNGPLWEDKCSKTLCFHCVFEHLAAQRGLHFGPTFWSQHPALLWICYGVAMDLLWIYYRIYYRFTMDLLWICNRFRGNAIKHVEKYFVILVFRSTCIAIDAHWNSWNAAPYRHLATPFFHFPEKL